MRIVDNHKDKIPDQDYVDICNNLEELYNDYNDDEDDDWHDIESSTHKTVKMILNIVTINIAINILIFIIYSKIMALI